MVSAKKYTVIIVKKADKFFHSLPEPHFSALKKAINALADEPRPFGYIKLTGESSYRCLTLNGLALRAFLKGNWECYWLLPSR